MADPSAFYEAEDEDLLPPLSMPTFNEAGQADAEYTMTKEELLQYQRHIQETQNGQDSAASLDMVPDDVQKFLVLFHKAIRDGDLSAITNMYESGWNRLTQAHYASSEWPEAETIAPLVENDSVFLTLYRELYFRHVYAKLQPTIDDRFQSYENICELFNYLLNSDGPVPLELPMQWLWDMLDEFVYQFQSFAQWRSQPSSKSEEELEMLAEGGQVWSCYSVLNVLYSLVQKSQIGPMLKAEKEGRSADEIAEIAGSYGSRPLYRTLGSFSLICLLRVHVMLGDPTLALQTMEDVELAGSSFVQRITACHVTTYYHVGCAYMSLSRWPDAIKTFISVLVFFTRMKQYHTRSYQYGSISKMCERMYGLLAICTTLSPGPSDESIMSIVREHYADQLNILQRGGDDTVDTYRSIFTSCCPKYLSVNSPPYEDPSALEVYHTNPVQDALQRQTDLFISDVMAAKDVSSVRNLLKLYTSIDADKLSSFLVNGEAKDGGDGTTTNGEEEVLQKLMVAKATSRTYGRAEGSLLDGDRIVISNLDFTIDGSMVHVQETTTHRRTAGFFVRNTEHAQRVFNAIRSAPLPSTRHSRGMQDRPAPPSGSTNSAGLPSKPGAAWQPKRQVRLAV